MESFVTLTIRDGKLAWKTYVCHDRRTYTIGRDEDCQIRLPSDNSLRSISRHHCQLEVHFPHVRVRDCGSHNGSFVNGARVKAQTTATRWAEHFHLSEPPPELKNGDELKLGTVVFKVCLVRRGTPPWPFRKPKGLECLKRPPKPNRTRTESTGKDDGIPRADLTRPGSLAVNRRSPGRPHHLVRVHLQAAPLRPPRPRHGPIFPGRGQSNAG